MRSEQRLCRRDQFEIGAEICQNQAVPTIAQDTRCEPAFAEHGAMHAVRSPLLDSRIGAPYA